MRRMSEHPSLPLVPSKNIAFSGHVRIIDVGQFMSDDYVIAFRNIASATNERTNLATLVPRAKAVGHSLSILELGHYEQPKTNPQPTKEGHDDLFNQQPEESTMILPETFRVADYLHHTFTPGVHEINATITEARVALQSVEHEREFFTMEIVFKTDSGHFTEQFKLFLRIDSNDAWGDPEVMMPARNRFVSLLKSVLIDELSDTDQLLTKELRAKINVPDDPQKPLTVLSFSPKIQATQPESQPETQPEEPQQGG